MENKVYESLFVFSYFISNLCCMEYSSMSYNTYRWPRDDVGGNLYLGYELSSNSSLVITC